MSLKPTIAGLAVSLALAFSPASATTITNTDGTFTFTGFDWAQGGTAYATGFTPTAGDPFTLTYFAYATNLVNGIFNIDPALLPNMDTIANGAPQSPPDYEYTIVATLQEQVISCTATSCDFAVLGGSFTIYYDTAANANATGGALGTGFQDGIAIMTGTINPLAFSTFSLITGSNSTTLTGVITNTNTTYVTPPFTGTTATTTLQLGDAITNWVNPGGFNGVAFTANDNPIFQADGNQSFTAAKIPEPGTLALLALGLLGFAGVRRKSH